METEERCKEHNELLKDLWSNDQYYCESCFLEYSRQQQWFQEQGYKDLEGMDND